MVPETSDSISLKSFIASMIQTVSPTFIVLPTSTNKGFSGEGFLYKVPIIGDLMVTYLESFSESLAFVFFGVSIGVSTGAA